MVHERRRHLSKGGARWPRQGLQSKGHFASKGRACFASDSGKQDTTDAHLLRPRKAWSVSWEKEPLPPLPPLKQEAECPGEGRGLWKRSGDSLADHCRKQRSCCGRERRELVTGPAGLPGEIAGGNAKNAL